MMSRISVAIPTSEDDFRAMARVREAAAIKAYSKDKGPSADEVKARYSEHGGIIDELKQQNNHARLVRLDKTIVAMCAWSSTGKQTAIKYLYVHPDHQGRGYGTLLLDAVLDSIPSSQKVQLTTQEAAEFYKNWGFRETGKIISDGITDEVVMVRRR